MKHLRNTTLGLYCRSFFDVQTPQTQPVANYNYLFLSENFSTPFFPVSWNSTTNSFTEQVFVFIQCFLHTSKDSLYPCEAHHLVEVRQCCESESHSVVSDSLRSHGLYSLWNSPGENAGVGSLSPLQEIFLTQESNQGLLHHRWILYPTKLSGKPWVVCVLTLGEIWTTSGGLRGFSRGREI